MIALGIALGATGYAAIGLSASSAENKQVRNARHVAAGARRAGGAKYFCTLPVTVMGRDSTNTTNLAGEAGL